MSNIHKKILIISWTSFEQFARRPNMRVFLLLIEQMWGPPSAFLLNFQNISPKAQCKCFCNANHVRNLLRSISFTIYFFITIFGLLADLDLQYFGALVSDPTPALKYLTCLQTVENDIELLT